MDVIVDRYAGFEVHKNTVMAAVRKPDGVGGRSEVVREFHDVGFTGRSALGPLTSPWDDE